MTDLNENNEELSVVLKGFFWNIEDAVGLVVSLLGIDKWKMWRANVFVSGWHLKKVHMDDDKLDEKMLDERLELSSQDECSYETEKFERWPPPTTIDCTLLDLHCKSVKADGSWELADTNDISWETNESSSSTYAEVLEMESSSGSWDRIEFNSEVEQIESRSDDPEREEEEISWYDPESIDWSKNSSLAGCTGRRAWEAETKVSTILLPKDENGWNLFSSAESWIGNTYSQMEEKFMNEINLHSSDNVEEDKVEEDEHDVEDQDDKE